MVVIGEYLACRVHEMFDNEAAELGSGTLNSAIDELTFFICGSDFESPAFRSDWCGHR